jgi:hypothetical protein
MEPTETRKIKNLIDFLEILLGEVNDDSLVKVSESHSLPQK